MISELMIGYAPLDREKLNGPSSGLGQNYWKHCHSAFASIARGRYDKEMLATRLMNYLESPEVRRGCNSILCSNLNLHMAAVDIIAQYPELYCTSKKRYSVSEKEKVQIYDLFKKLKRNYSRVKDSSANKKQVTKIIATDTFITKIMLGTLGCIPAFDSMVHYTLTNDYDGRIQNTFTRNSFSELIDKFFMGNAEFEKIIADRCNDQTGYSPMKALDEYLINSAHRYLYK